MDVQQIKEELEIAMAQCQTMEAQIRQTAREMGIDPMMMRYSDGTSCMMPVVLSKSNLLPALYAIQKDRKQEEDSQKILDWFAGLRRNQNFLDDKKDKS